MLCRLYAVRLVNLWGFIALLQISPAFLCLLFHARCQNGRPR